MALFATNALAQTTVCASGCDTTTIQDAIDITAAGGTITIMDAVHTETGIVVGKSLTITGQGQNTTILQAAAAPGVNTTGYMIRQIEGDIVLSNMTMRYGAGVVDGGKGPTAPGSLTFTNLTITDNTATGNLVDTSFNSLTMTNCLISGNTASSGFSLGYTGTTLTNSQISDNTFNYHAMSFHKSGFTMDRSTMANNATDGCIYLGYTTATLTNSTLSNNGSIGMDVNFSARGVLVNSTVTGHDVGINVNNFSCQLTSTNSILAGNTTDLTVADPTDIFTNGGNLCGDGTCVGFRIPNGNADLQPLAINGGVTQTHALGANSDARDAGDDSLAPAVDQNGTSRPQGIASDLGSFEAAAITPVAANYATFAYTSITTLDAVFVEGDMGVREGSLDTELKLNQSSYVSGNLYADTIHLQNYVEVTGDATYNERINPGTGDIYGTETMGLTTPLADPTPPVPAFTSNGSNVILQSYDTVVLDPGTYGVVKLKYGAEGDHAVLQLTGGVYNFKRLIVQDYGLIECLGPCEIRVQEYFRTTWRGFIGPLDGAGMTAGDVVIWAGNSGNNAVKIESETAVQAHIYAPYGRINTVGEAQILGKLVADRINLGWMVGVSVQD